MEGWGVWGTITTRDVWDVGCAMQLFHVVYRVFSLHIILLPRGKFGALASTWQGNRQFAKHWQAAKRMQQAQREHRPEKNEYYALIVIILPF